MKINRKVILIFLPLAIILGLIILVFNGLSSNTFSILSGIFTGVLITLLMAFIGYFDKKNEVTNEVTSELIELYRKLLISHEHIREFSMKVHHGEDINKLSLNAKLFSEKIRETTNNIEKHSGKFCPLLPKTKLGAYFSVIDAHTKKVNRLLNSISELDVSKMTYEGLKMELELLQNKVQLQMLPNEVESLKQQIDLKINEINTLKSNIYAVSSQIQGYQVALIDELNFLLEEYIKEVDKKKQWVTIREEMHKSFYGNK